MLKALRNHSLHQPTGIIVLLLAGTILNALFLWYAVHIPGIELLPDLQEFLVKSVAASVTTYSAVIFVVIIKNQLTNKFFKTMLTMLIIFKFIFFFTCINLNIHSQAIVAPLIFITFSLTVDLIISATILKST